MSTVSTTPNWRAVGVGTCQPIVSNLSPPLQLLLPVRCRRRGLRPPTVGRPLARFLHRHQRRRSLRPVTEASLIPTTQRRARHLRRPRDITTTGLLGRRGGVTRATTAPRRRPVDAAARRPCPVPPTAPGRPIWRRPVTLAAAVLRRTVLRDIDDSRQ